ncbi:lanthionine synthetase C family protein [Polycladomyces sp. WAk]|uniref:Lanthionine synthetase C family protein n=1 Tax=Polycladomyces zharkentensis TaxID=2807616 RepID=A0ABS2WGW7_9BACL|nr:lanthionine synthetase C family protein [Polycladomyces sp. WAk]MBN2908803.1 lanthionine synthetase C family protein [Polycladomyces sp. WAk]
MGEGLTGCSGINPVLADRAMEISQTISERLIDPIAVRRIVKQPDNVSVTGATPWGDISLSHGYPGCVLLFAHWDWYEPGQQWDYHAHQHILQIKEYLEEKGAGSISLFSGLSGVAFACQAASREGERYVRFLDLVNTAIIREVDRLIERDRERRKKERGVSPKVYDVISGLSGIGRYLLNNPQNGELSLALEKVLHYLIELCEMTEVDNHMVPGWFIPRKYQFLEREMTLFPHGNFNCGMAHGIPGPLALLSLASLRNYRVDKQLETIRNISDWLLRRMHEDEYGPLWPDRIRFEDEIQEKKSEKYFTREAWCYGTPGVSRSMYLAGKALEDDDLKDIAIRSLKASLSRPEELQKLESPTFCHGKTGLMQILIRMAWETGEECFIQHAETLAVQVMGMFQEEAPFGYQDIEGGKRLDKAGLLEGVSGIGLALMSLKDEKYWDWDAAFLIS